MESDRELTKATAVDDLRSALMNGAGVADALRACWYRHPLFASALMTETVRRRFASDGDVRLVTGFVGRIPSPGGSGSTGFPSREAEAIMRACLGDVALLETVDPAQISYPELGIAITGRLFEEWQPSAEEVLSLLADVKSALPAMHEMFPELGPGEDDWFAAGMADSPFAVPMGTGPDPRGCQGK